mmetsp:Transcript_37074/g.107022  ORF Transcript_37074/g.107022 Transcript_37074/m.107022 type:complete len:244 (-) Transcript_37074:1041-1772(-)
MGCSLHPAATGDRGIEHDVLGYGATVRERGPSTRGIRAIFLAAVRIAACGDVRPQCHDPLRKLPLDVVEVSTITFVVEALRGVACLATVKVRAILRREAEDSTTTTVVHEVRLAEDECHLILVHGTQVRQVVVWHGRALRIAPVPIIESVQESAAGLGAIEGRRAPPSIAMTLVRAQAPQHVDVHDVVAVVRGVQAQRLPDKARPNHGQNRRVVKRRRQRPQGPIGVVVWLVEASLCVGAEEE